MKTKYIDSKGRIQTIITGEEPKPKKAKEKVWLRIIEEEELLENPNSPDHDGNPPPHAA
jgi:hypothetical protein